MTTVNISGTWSEKARPNNGLSPLAGLIHGDRILRVPVVAYVEFHQWTEKATGEVLTVSIPVIEPAIEADGSDPSGTGKQVMDLLDALRKQRGKGSIEDVPSGGGDLPGQEAFDFDGLGDDPEEGDGSADTNASGDPVPPPSGEEIQAERAEAKAAKGRKPPTADFSDVPPNAGSAS
jgi:hypothetical protein